MTSFSADRPVSDPKEDLLGYAPFAENLAKAIRRYPGSDPLVLALHGPWGSGKSTVLNFVIHYLGQVPENDRPVIVTFNPWWFSGQESLARAFLGQLQAVLPGKSARFEKLGDLLGDFAEGIGGLIDLSGMTGGVGAKLGNLIGMAAKRKPKDVPALKAEISQILKEAGKRILVVIDDIDRLTPEETRQLFTVIKALADFPNVVYLLAFDREVAAQAIEQQGGLPGERYLEKIIQVPFELPHIDRVAIRGALFERLNQILVGTPDSLFDQSYWENVYYEGIDPLIKVPRDIVRLTNTLSITYPAVQGEVNPVDFIALEAIRVFLPDLYVIIRSNPHRFVGHGEGLNDIDREAAQAFHQRWENEIPEPLRESMRSLVVSVFPKVGLILSPSPLGIIQRGFDSSVTSEWRRKLRACHSDIFPIYFRLSLPPGTVSRQEMETLLSLAGSLVDFKNALIQAKSERRPDGLSKARALLERLLDHVEHDIPEENVPTIIQAILDVGDDLIDPNDEKGFLDVGNEFRASRLVYHLLKRLPRDRRTKVLSLAIEEGRAIVVQLLILQVLDQEHSKAEMSHATLTMPAEDIATLKEAWIERVRAISRESTLLHHQKLPQLLALWKHWGDANEVREWCNRITKSNEGLLGFLSKFLQHRKSFALGDPTVRIKPRLNPYWLKDYIDTKDVAQRLLEMDRNRLIPDTAREAVFQYLKEYEMLEAGKDPDAPFAFDE
ncbi:MAG: NTPase [Fimbriimonadales bacterium]|nr:MAG: NTPase [Fimbriimonadales bacterium]